MPADGCRSGTGKVATIGAFATLLAIAGCTALRPDCTTAESDPRASSAACVVVADGRLLTIRHRFGGKLGLPGGTAHDGESASCAAQRETWEETGYRVRVREPVGSDRPHAPVFHCELAGGQDVRDQRTPPLHALPEVRGIYWIRPEALRGDDWRFPEQLDWLPDAVRAIARRSTAAEDAGP